MEINIIDRNLNVETGEPIKRLVERIHEYANKSNKPELLNITEDSIVDTIDVWEHEECISSNPNGFIITIRGDYDDLCLECETCNKIICSLMEDLLLRE